METYCIFAAVVNESLSAASISVDSMPNFGTRKRVNLHLKRSAG